MHFLKRNFSEKLINLLRYPEQETSKQVEFTYFTKILVFSL